MSHTTLRTIRLYGELGARFGRVHRLAVASAAEAVRALVVLLPGFEAHLLSSNGQGRAYAVFLGRTNIGEQGLFLPAGSADVRIAPVIQGSKRGGGLQTVLGAALIAFAFATGTFSLAASMGVKFTAAGQFAFNLGVAMSLGGVAQMLSPTARGISAADRPDNKPSYNFNGPVNTSAQGNPVPLAYGLVLAGSAVISAGIYAEDQA